MHSRRVTEKMRLKKEIYIDFKCIIDTWLLQIIFVSQYMQVHSFLGNNRSAIWQSLYPRFKIQKNYTNNQFNSIMESKNKFTGCKKTVKFSNKYLSFNGAEKEKAGVYVQKEIFEQVILSKKLLFMSFCLSVVTTNIFLLACSLIIAPFQKRYLFLSI